MNQQFHAITTRSVFFALLFSLVTAKSAGMVLELDSRLKFIQVTPAYSNAVMATLLPHYSDFAKKLDLPISLPIKPEDIARCAISPQLTADDGIYLASITLKNGFQFVYGGGYVMGFSRGNSYYGLQDPDEIPKFYGQVRMTTNEAVKLARKTLKKIGIPLEDVFADREPEINLPSHRDTTNVVPRYELEWPDPLGSYIKMEINAETGQVEFLYMLCPNLKRPSLKIDVLPPKGHGMFDSELFPEVNPEYAWKLIPVMFKAIDKYAETLSLPIPRPLTTNNVASVKISNNGGWPHCEIMLTNGWHFVYRHTMVNGYYSPNGFFPLNSPFHLKDFEGKWNLNTNQAIELVKTTLAKLNFPTNYIHMDFAPNIRYADGNFKKMIPRYFFEWDYENATHNDLQSKVEAEVNADTGKLESLYYDDKAYWGSRPSIDIPISKK